MDNTILAWKCGSSIQRRCQSHCGREVTQTKTRTYCFNFFNHSRSSIFPSNFYTFSFLLHSLAFKLNENNIKIFWVCETSIKCVKIYRRSMRLNENENETNCLIVYGEVYRYMKTQIAHFHSCAFISMVNSQQQQQKNDR